MNLKYHMEFRYVQNLKLLLIFGCLRDTNRSTGNLGLEIDGRHTLILGKLDQS